MALRGMVRLMIRSVALALGCLFVVVVLSACGEDEPAVCTSVESLQTAIDDVREIDPSADTIPALNDGLLTIEDSLEEVKSDAQTEFASSIESVETSYAALTQSVSAAQADPTATTLGEAGTALSAFASDADSLVSDIQSTC